MQRPYLADRLRARLYTIPSIRSSPSSADVGKRSGITAGSASNGTAIATGSWRLSVLGTRVIHPARFSAVSTLRPVRSTRKRDQPSASTSRSDWSTRSMVAMESADIGPFTNRRLSIARS